MPEIEPNLTNPSVSPVLAVPDHDVVPPNGQGGSFLRLLPVAIIGGLVRPSSRSMPQWLMITSLVIGIFTTPFWSRLGDVRGRRFTLAISIIANILIAALLVLASLLGAHSLEILLPITLLNGLSGSWVTFHGALLAYTADVSSSSSLVGNFCILAALNMLTWVVTEGFVHSTDPYVNIVKVAVGAILLLYVRYALDDFRPVQVQLPTSDQDQVRPSLRGLKATLKQYRPLKWIQAAAGMLRLNPVLALSTPCLLIVGFTDRITLSLLRHAYQFDVYITIKDLLGPIILLLFGGLSILLLRHPRTNLLEAVKAFALGSAVMYAIYQLAATIAFACRAQTVYVTFTLLSSLAIILTPSIFALTFLHFELEVEGSSSDRSSLFGSLSLVQSIGFALAILATPTETRLLILVFSAVVCALSFVVALLLSFVPRTTGSDEPGTVSREEEERSDAISIASDVSWRRV